MRLDFDKLADDLIAEMKSLGIPMTEIAQRLGITRQCLHTRIKKHTLTTRNLTTLATMSITRCGGSVMLEYLEADSYTVHVTKQSPQEKEK